MRAASGTTGKSWQSASTAPDDAPMTSAVREAKSLAVSAASIAGTTVG
jgi:hypothetical protein